MVSERARVVLVGVVCVLAVVAAAATLASPEPTSASSGGDSIQSDGPAEYEGDGGESTADPLGQPGELRLDVGACIPWLYSTPFWLAVAGVGVAGWLYARRRQDALAATAYLSVLALPFAMVWLLLSKCGPESNTPKSIVPSDIVATPRGGDAAFGVLGDGSTVASPIWLVAVIAVLGVGALAVALAGAPDDTDDPDDPTPDAATAGGNEDVAALRETAGRAADRIERAEGVDNEIYRAWVEMTESLDVEHPESSTPGEFAAAATDAGIDSATVAELTDLFERVRYGDEPPTAETEARAVDALRDVETTPTDLDDVWGDD